MSRIFQKGDTLWAEVSQAECVVEEFIGEGSQGQVYRARVGGQSLAMKWYFYGEGGPTQRSIIHQLINMRSPDERRFLWPIDLVTSSRVGMAESFGYTMPLREQRFVSIPAWLRRECAPTFWALVTAAIGFTDAFHALHAGGFVYRDINDGNVFFDPATGDALICDNDNVGIRDQAMFKVIGTPGFMAPEVAKGRCAPNAESDLYSLSVLLFKLLIVHHPLVGRRLEQIKCKNPAADWLIYVDQPVFVHDPVDRSNEPDAVLHENALVFWNLYPQVLRDRFVEAFTKGLKNPQQRVWEVTWKNTLYAVRDAIFPCHHPSCREDNFYHPGVLAKTGGGGMCWRCRRPVSLPPRLRIGGRPPIMLHSRTRLYAFHLNLNENNHQGPVAEIRQHPSGVLGLHNLTNKTWQAETGDNRMLEVPHGGTLKVADRLQITFPSGVKGEIRT